MTEVTLLLRIQEPYSVTWGGLPEFGEMEFFLDHTFDFAYSSHSVYSSVP